MAFVRRKPTEKEVKYLESFNIRCRMGHAIFTKSSEVVYEEENNFYMFYIIGPGFERENLPMYFGIVWNDIPMVLEVYHSSTGKLISGFHETWKFRSLTHKNKSYTPKDEKTMELIKNALTATNGGFTSLKILDNEFINF